MVNYNTVEEMSARWGVTARYVQSLCRLGKFNDAVKRSGIWFIPDDTPSPVKNTRGRSQPFNFVGTRKKVFDNAIELFMMHGFENVTIKDIANSVGIIQSAVYNHFKSKQDLLDTIYAFYSHYFLINKPKIEDLEPILHNGSLMDMIYCMRYDFTNEQGESNRYIEQKMLEISLLIYHRQLIDERAKELLKSLIFDERIYFGEKVLSRAIEIGRLAPFDVHAISVLINSIRVYTLQMVMMDKSPENVKARFKEEQMSFKIVVDTFTDLNL